MYILFCAFPLQRSLLLLFCVIFKASLAKGRKDGSGERVSPPSFLRKDTWAQRGHEERLDVVPVPSFPHSFHKCPCNLVFLRTLIPL